MQHSLIVEALGKTDDRIHLASLGTLHLATVEQAHFSMATPKDISQLHEHNFKSRALGTDVRCVVSGRHQSISTFVVACLCAAVHPGLSRSQL